MTTEDELVKEYKRMLERWQSRGLFFHFLAFTKRFAKKGWLRSKDLHKIVCASLAIARLGLPITTTLISYITGLGVPSVYSKTVLLSSYNVLHPVTLKDGTRTRFFKLSEEFIRYGYSKLKEIES